MLAVGMLVSPTTGREASAPTSAPAFSGAALPSRHFRQIKLFDFDEERLGNFEDQPMHWTRMTGDDFPPFAETAFDKRVGHNSPPSFWLQTPLESVACEYEYPDLDVFPGADYLVEGYIRAVGVVHSRALISACLVDQLGSPIVESQQVSQLVRSVGVEDEPWQRVQVEILGSFPEAAALRLRVMLLQRYLWLDPPAEDVDPIIRQDIHPAAWFDDIAVYRLPRAELRLSGTAPLVLEGRKAALVVDAPNSGDEALEAKLKVTDAYGRERHTLEFEIAALELDAVECPLLALPAGVYEAELTLSSKGQRLLQRHLNFAVLADLEGVVAERPDMGVDLPPHRIHDVEAARDLFHYLECGAVRVGVPMIGELDTGGKLAYFQELSALLRHLATRQIDLTGVILAPGAFHNLDRADSTRGMIERDPKWREKMSPVLAQQIGGLISTWQVGAERLEVDALPWTDELLAALRSHFARFVTLPRLVVPLSSVAPDPSAASAVSYWLPPEVPTRTLVRHLEPLIDEQGNLPALFMGADHETAIGHEDRVADLARRTSLCKALGTNRLVLPAPIEPTSESGASSWQPTETYVAVRTLCHYLSGRACLGVISLEHDGLALIFDGPPGSCIVAWTWRPDAQTRPVELYLGDDPVAVDLWGNRRSLAVKEGRAQVYLTPSPMIMTDVDPFLVLLQSSVEITPTNVEVSDREMQPLLRLRNAYDETLVARIDFEVPERWQLEPTTLELEAPANALYECPLDLEVPRREIAAERPLTIRMQISSPTVADMVFDVPVEVGLHDIDVGVEARWEDDVLVVTQTLFNDTDEPVSFAAFCQAPLRPLIERAFVNVQPKESQTTTYRLADPQVRELTGLSLHVGLREYRGKRELDQLVEVPR